MTIDQIELTPTGIALIAPDESRVELCGRDVWKLLLWMNWHVIELGQRQEMEGQPTTPPPAVQEPPPKEES